MEKREICEGLNVLHLLPELFPHRTSESTSKVFAYINPCLHPRNNFLCQLCYDKSEYPFLVSSFENLDSPQIIFRKQNNE